MVSSKETTPAAYLASLPPERAMVIAKVRAVIRKKLPKGYVEAMNWGMLSYEIPLSTYPDTYNKQPYAYVALAAQKNNYAIYMMNVYAHPPLIEAVKAWYATRGKRLDMGKCCLRFKRLEDIPLDLVGDIIAATPVDEMIAIMERTHPRR
jgi:Domain of unknown function (DU1801)